MVKRVPSAWRSLIGASPALADAEEDCGRDTIYDALLDLVSTLASDVLVYTGTAVLRRLGI